MPSAPPRRDDRAPPAFGAGLGRRAHRRRRGIVGACHELDPRPPQPASCSTKDAEEPAGGGRAVRPPFTPGVGAFGDNRAHARHARRRPLTDAEFTPAQADAITDAVRQAAEQRDQVSTKFGSF